MHVSHDTSSGLLKEGGQNRRLRLGGVMLFVALGAAILLVQADVPRIWRLGLFFPFVMASFGAWQGLYRVCPGMTSKGVKEDELGNEQRMVRPEEIEHAKCLSRRVMFASSLTALSATALVFFLP